MSYLQDLRREVDFILFDWLRLDVERETAASVFDLSERLAQDAFAPHHRLSDQREPSIEGNAVTVLPEVRAALKTYAELGLFSAGFAPELDGMGLPQSVCAGSFLFFAAANLATSAYPMLTVANARLLATFGSPQQVETFARPQIEGRWFGTMCLSEPQAGSSLGDILTRAKPDGVDALGARYRLSGAKMWISGAQHDIADNIVHLVLAKAVGSDGATVPGTAGISLFVVPKILPDGAENDVSVAGLNHKLGYRGIPNCALNFGEGRELPDGGPGAVGWRIGEEGQGLRQMFHMMNEARIGVSLGAAAVGYRGFRQSLLYASDRIQGRRAGASRQDTTRVAIIEHPDVRRMLMQQKLYCEGALALTFLCASLSDDGPRSEPLLALLTPVAKSWVSTWTLKANDIAIQIHGGSGYTRDFDVEQLWRDNRLNPIHEGTNGIQAIDLVERKLLRGDQAGFAELRRRISAAADRAGEDEGLAPLASQLRGARDQLEASIADLRQLPERGVLTHASAFLDAFGHVVVAWLWLEQALSCSGRGDDYAVGKRLACAAFYALELPAISGWLSPIKEGEEQLRDITLSQF